MEFHAALVVLRAAPVLLGSRPALHPIGEASVAIVDSPMCVSHSFGKDMTVEVVAAMPGARASHAHVVTAPGLLVCRPSEEPIGVAFMAVIVEAMLLVDNLRWRAHIVGLVDHMRLRPHWDRNVYDPAGLLDVHRNLVVDHFSLCRVINTSTSVCVAAIRLLFFTPQVLPVMEAFVALIVWRKSGIGPLGNGPKPHQHASVHLSQLMSTRIDSCQLREVG